MCQRLHINQLFFFLFFMMCQSSLECQGYNLVHKFDFSGSQPEKDKITGESITFQGQAVKFKNSALSINYPEDQNSFVSLPHTLLQNMYKTADLSFIVVYQVAWKPEGPLSSVFGIGHDPNEMAHLTFSPQGFPDGMAFQLFTHNKTFTLRDNRSPWNYIGRYQCAGITLAQNKSEISLMLKEPTGVTTYKDTFQYGLKDVPSLYEAVLGTTIHPNSASFRGYIDRFEIYNGIFDETQFQNVCDDTKIVSFPGQPIPPPKNQTTDEQITPPEQSEPKDQQSKSTLSTLEIGGIVIAIFAGISLLVFASYFFTKRSRARIQPTDSSVDLALRI